MDTPRDLNDDDLDHVHGGTAPASPDADHAFVAALGEHDGQAASAKAGGSVQDLLNAGVQAAQWVTSAPQSRPAAAATSLGAGPVPPASAVSAPPGTSLPDMIGLPGGAGGGIAGRPRR